tara:strand:- start:4728 stop:6551 length:1824 start_codon:yes stop_codon:yes gene_type:complete
MASPITQRVKSYAKQTQDNLRKDASKIVVNDKNQLGYNLENKSQLGAEAPALVEASEGTVTGQMAGPKMSDKDWLNYLKNESPERKAERLQQQQDAGVREGVVTQDEADAQNAANQEANNENKEYGNFVPIELENKYQDVQSRSEVMNQVRRNRSLQRNIKRENNKARRALNKKKRRGTLSEQDVKDLTYYNNNRYTSGTGGNVVRDADGNITGSKLENAMGDMSRSIGTQLKTSGGSINDNANREEILRRGINSINNQKVKTGYIQKAYSGYQNAPSPKKQVGGELLDKAGNKIGDVSKTGSFSKVGSDIVPYKGPKVKSLGTGVNNASSTGTKLLNKVNKGLNNMPNKGKAGLFKKAALGLTALTATYLGGKAILGSSDSDDKPKPPPVTPPKKGKSYDQAYQDRDRKTYGHMNKSNYIKEAKRQNDVFAKTGKWDYKNAPKDPGPVSTIKPAKVAPVSSSAPEIKAPVNLDKISQPERKPTISNKQGKALNKLSRLEGRKQTSKRDIRIAKQKDKAAGLSRKQVKQNKRMRKAGTNITGGASGSQSQITMPRVMNSSQYEQVKKLGNGSAIDAVTSGKVTIKGLEDQLKSSAGFKQKGWSGYQK